MDYETKQAFKYTLGVLYGISVVVVTGQILSWIISPHIPVDPTDKDYHHRSGLEYYHDYGTGKEYISSGCGSPLVERVK